MNTTPTDDNHPHYPWGPSAAKQWRGCPGSVSFIATARGEGKIPEDTTSSYAEEGTEAHDWADRCLKSKIKLDEIPSNFREHLSGYIELAKELEQSNGGEVFNEQLIPLFYNKSEKGTVDYAVVSDNQVDILDLKYGVGVLVEAENNDPLAIYAMSLVEEYKDAYKFTNGTKVRMHIYQPRHRDFDGAPFIWEVTLEDLKDICIDIEDAYVESKNATASDLKPSSDACQFCDARRICPARASALFEDVVEGLNPFKGGIDPSNVEITDEVRLLVFKKQKDLAKWMDELNEDTTRLIESGTHIPGLKTIDGALGNRAWVSEEEAAKLLRDLPAAKRFKPRVVISPAQAEKVLKAEGSPLESKSTRFQNRFNNLITRKEGKPKLALESDPKPARIPTAERFDEEISEDDCF